MRPSLLRRSYWTARRLAILIGFVLTSLSSLGPHYCVGPIEERSAAAEEAGASLAGRIEALRGAQAQYLLFQQIGAMIYALNAAGLSAPGSAQRDTLASLYQLALVDRSNPIRQVIGELAMAKTLVYRETADRYAEIIDAARKDVSLATYQAVDDFETGILAKANALMAALQQAAAKRGGRAANSTPPPRTARPCSWRC